MHSPFDLKKRKKGVVYVWGCNESSQLGLGAVTDHQYEPVPLTTLKKVKPVYVSSGSHFCAVITSEGQIYTWGKGESGQLGLNDYSNGHIPQRISLFKKKKSLLATCGDKLMLSIPADKSGVCIWGEGTEGQHGMNQTPFTNIPSPICIDLFSKKKVISVGAGTNHCCCVIQNPSGDTDVYSWGQGEKGKLGNNSEQPEYTPYLIEALRGTRVVMVACGSDYTAVLTERGHVYTWGGGDSGRLGIGNTQGSMVPVCLAKLSQVEVVEISCGPDHMAAVTSQGKLYTWGYGSNGRLGIGEESDVLEPTQVLDLDNEFVVSVCCGGHHTAAVTQNGLLYTFGWNYYGQLGLGMVNSRKDSQLSPCLVESLKAHQVLQVSCGEQHTLALVI